MSSTRSGAAAPVTLRKGSISVLHPGKMANVNDVASDGSGGGHGGARQVRSDPAALAVFEIAVGGGDAALTRLRRIAVGAGAHGAARIAPLEPCREEDVVEAFRLGKL